MKKLFFGLVMFFVVVSKVFAADMSPNMYVLFGESITASNHNLTQTYIQQSSTSYSHLRNSCGTIAALAVHNYFNYAYYGDVDGFTQSKQTIENAVIDIFNNSYIDRANGGIPRVVGQFQDGENIRTDLANYRWGWSTKIIRSTSVGYNYDNMINWDLKSNRPVIALVKSYSPLNVHNADHFVVILYATSTNVGYFDPWDGNMKISTKNEFLSSWVSTNYGVVIKP